MHELSIVMNVIDIATQQAKINEAYSIDEIEIDIGMLAGIEMDAFDFAWQQAVKGTMLEHAKRHINRIDGLIHCPECGKDSVVQNIYDGCPECGNPFVQVKKGKELIVRSLVIT
jgi:hydrogenase nickel incorporation protein HypA/HybF